MSKFIKGNKKDKSASITTAALPDIVFMLLFFFMVATKSKESDSSVMITLPTATETGKLEDKTPTAHISIGVPVKALQEFYGKNSRIQLNDAISGPEDVQMFITEKRASIEKSFEKAQPGIGKKKAEQMVICLKVDKETQLGTLGDVRKQLQEVRALKVNYIVNKAVGKQ